MLFILDEAQVLNSSHRDFGAKLLQMRHHGVHLLANFQNLSLAPIEFINNCDVLICFRSVGADMEAFARAANLKRDQSASIARLQRTECMCVLMRSNWKQAFKGKAITIEFVNADNSLIEQQSRAFVQRFIWKAAEEEESVETDVVTASFLRDVLNQAHEFSALTQRFERAGVRSASKQGAIIRDLCAMGYIKIWPLAIGKGRPIKLCEPMSKALDEYGVKWKKTRGTLPTRAATEFLVRKLKKMKGWRVIEEGRLGDKQVDLLCRDPQDRLVTIEIAGNADHEVHNALHCLKYAEVRKHVVVCLGKGVLDAVKKKFAGFPELAGNQRVELLLLSKALGDSWEL